MCAFISRTIGRQEMTAIAMWLPPSRSCLFSFTHFCLPIRRVTAGYFRLRWSFSRCHCNNVRWHLLKKRLPQE